MYSVVSFTSNYFAKFNFLSVSISETYIILSQFFARKLVFFDKKSNHETKSALTNNNLAKGPNLSKKLK